MKRIVVELKIAFRVVKRFLRHVAESYRLQRKHIILAACLETPEGRRLLGEAMIKPMLSISKPVE